jgi:hypothetical protein
LPLELLFCPIAHLRNRERLSTYARKCRLSKRVIFARKNAPRQNPPLRDSYRSNSSSSSGGSGSIINGTWGAGGEISTFQVSASGRIG